MQSGTTPQTQDYFSDLRTPDMNDQELHLQQLVQQGVLTPEEAQTISLGESDLNNISTDPGLKKAQMDSLLGLQEISDSGGMTAKDKANLSRIANEEASSAKGKRDAIIQNANARGMGGSGLELMANLQNEQDAATRKSQRDLDVAGMAEERALEALMKGGSLAGDIQNQDFNQQAKVADSNDAISRFNAQNRQNQINQNVNARNDAAAKNLAVKQNISDQNVGLNNSQQQHNKNLIQQKYENELKKRGGSANIQMQNSQAAGQNSQGAANSNNQTIGAGLSAAAMFMSDERAKEDIEEFSPEDFLDSITGYKFKYKDKKHGDGENVGVMAQDLEKTEAGSKLVVDTPEGKVVDYSKSGPQIMASLADLNDRLRKMEGDEDAV